MVICKRKITNSLVGLVVGGDKNFILDKQGKAMKKSISFK